MDETGRKGNSKLSIEIVVVGRNAVGVGCLKAFPS
jgi:hypothetical protein